MKRLDFIRLGVGASAVTLAGTFPSFSQIRSNPMARWAHRHRVTMTDRPEELRMIARPSRSAFPTTLRELHELADGPLRCSGSHITGIVSGQAFHLELRPTGGIG